MSLDDMKDPNAATHVVKSMGASGSIATMSNEALLVSHPSAMDPAVLGVIKGRERGLTADNVVRMPSAKAAAILTEGDKVYHKMQKIEAIYAGEVKGHPTMAFVKVGTKRSRVKKENLVKL